MVHSVAKLLEIFRFLRLKKIVIEKIEIEIRLQAI